MRRKNRPGKWRPIRRVYPDIRDDQSQAYIISGEAQATISAVIESILEECLQDAKNLATASGKRRVSSKEMETALRKLCVRLSTQSCTPSKQRLNR